MAGIKRSATDEAQPHTERTKKPRTGFKVGPDHLPDGTYRRHAQKIKKDLIHKSKVYKQYAKLKKRQAEEAQQTQEQQQQQKPLQHQAEDVEQDGQNEHNELQGSGNGSSSLNVQAEKLVEERDRDAGLLQANQIPEDTAQDTTNPSQIDHPEEQPDQSQTDSNIHPSRRPQVRRVDPYAKARAIANAKAEAAEARRLAREEANRQREEKLERRDRERKMMDKARRPGKTGQRRLGRESQVLLERVRRVTADG